MNSTDATDARATDATGDFVVDIRSGKHRLRLVRPLPRFEPTLNSALAIRKFPAIFSVHSKGPPEWVLIGVRHLLDAYERAAFRVFLFWHHACAGPSPHVLQYGQSARWQ